MCNTVRSHRERETNRLLYRQTHNDDKRETNRLLYRQTHHDDKRETNRLLYRQTHNDDKVFNRVTNVDGFIQIS